MFAFRDAPSNAAPTVNLRDSESLLHPRYFSCTTSCSSDKKSIRVVDSDEIGVSWCLIVPSHNDAPRKRGIQREVAGAPTTEVTNTGQRMPRLPLFESFPSSSTRRRHCIWRECTPLARARLERRLALCHRPILALQRRAGCRSYRHFRGCLSNLKRGKFPRQLLRPISMRFPSKPYRSLCGTANH